MKTIVKLYDKYLAMTDPHGGYEWTTDISRAQRFLDVGFAHNFLQWFKVKTDNEHDFVEVSE